MDPGFLTQLLSSPNFLSGTAAPTSTDNVNDTGYALDANRVKNSFADPFTRLRQLALLGDPFAQRLMGFPQLAAARMGRASSSGGVVG